MCRRRTQEEVCHKKEVEQPYSGGGKLPFQGCKHTITVFTHFKLHKHGMTTRLHSILFNMIPLSGTRRDAGCFHCYETTLLPWWGPRTCHHNLFMPLPIFTEHLSCYLILFNQLVFHFSQIMCLTVHL